MTLDLAHATDPPTDLIQSLRRGLRALELVVEGHEPPSVKEIAVALGVSLGTAYHLINTLAYEGYIERGPGRVLRPGPRALGRAGRRPAADEVPISVRRALARTAYAVDDVAVLSRLRGGEAVVLAVEEVVGATNGGRYVAGSRRLPHLTAAGRAMLAALPADGVALELERVGDLARARAELVDRSRLASELDSTREAGHAVVVADGEACVGAAVVDRRGHPLGAIAVVVSPRRVRHSRERLVRTVRQSADTISRLLAEPGSATRSSTPSPGGSSDVHDR